MLTLSKMGAQSRAGASCSGFRAHDDGRGGRHYDAYEFYEAVEKQGARPVTTPRKDAKRGTAGGAPRSVPALRLRVQTTLGKEVEDAGVHRQRRKLGFRVLAYNANKVHEAIP